MTERALAAIHPELHGQKLHRLHLQGNEFKLRGLYKCYQKPIWQRRTKIHMTFHHPWDHINSREAVALPPLLLETLWPMWLAFPPSSSRTSGDDKTSLKIKSIWHDLTLERGFHLTCHFPFTAKWDSVGPGMGILIGVAPQISQATSH